jgi:hypothetical protein
MRKLSEKEVEEIRAAYNENYDDLCKQKAVFEAPLGELYPNLSGFAFAWQLKGDMPSTHSITGKEGFNAQGIEGKLRKDTTMATAIIYYVSCDRFRRAIYI